MSAKMIYVNGNDIKVDGVGYEIVSEITYLLEEIRKNMIAKGNMDNKEIDDTLVMLVLDSKIFADMSKEEKNRLSDPRRVNVAAELWELRRKALEDFTNFFKSGNRLTICIQERIFK